jgi:CRP/FNR family cyclic AMP-dependent transcriptional regulator
VKGTVKVGLLSVDGREAAFEMRGPWEFVGLTSLCGEGTRSADAIALTDSVLLPIPLDLLRELGSRSPRVASELVRSLGARVRREREALTQALFGDVRARLAGRLLQLARLHGRRHEHGVLIDLPLVQQELARMVGATRETVSRTLGDFVDTGWLRVDDRRYVVTDPESLLAKASCSARGGSP